MSNKYYNCLERSGTKHFNLKYSLEQYPGECLSVSEKCLTLSCHAVIPSCITYCESVFRKSLIENVVVFLTNGRTEQHSLRVDSWDRYICALILHIYYGVGYCVVLSWSGSYHNLQSDKRKSAPHFLFCNSLIGVVRNKEKSMKKLFYVVLALSLSIVSCSKFDDTEIWNKLNDHETRIAYLEEICEKMNADIINLQALVTALEGNDYIVSASPLVTGDGYTFVFKSGKSVVIYNGKDGVNGTNGIDGVDGKNGETPIISVMKDVDGIYYWTVNGEWLIVNGEKVRASAMDGNNGVNGENGKDGITPKFKIENDYWYVSYTNGASWEKLGKATGNNGLNGDDGDSFFKGVSMADGFVQFTLNDDNGTVIKVPYLMEDTLVFVSDKPGDVKQKLTNQQKRSVVHLIVEGYIDGADVRYLADQMLALEILDLRKTNLTEVPAYAFCKGEVKYGKDSIREVYLPEECLSIGEYAFYGCVNLRVLDASGVVDLGAQAIQYCSIDKLVATLGGNVWESSNSNVKHFEYSKNANVARSLSEVIVDTVFCHTGITTISAFGSNTKSVIFEEPSTIKAIEEGDLSNAGIDFFRLPSSVEILESLSLPSSKTFKMLVIPANSALSKIGSQNNQGPFGSDAGGGDCSVICYLEKPLSMNCLFYYSSGYSSYHLISNGNLYVLKASLSLYLNSHWARDFKNILPIEDSEYKDVKF